MSTRPVNLQVGSPLTGFTLSITPSVVVATAIATRDYQDVHHDPAVARAAGSDDVFLNILTTNGLAERLVMEWAGPTARLLALQIRLGAPCYPGDELELTGEVSACEEDVVHVRIRGAHARGAHFTGTAEVTWSDAGGQR